MIFLHSQRRPSRLGPESSCFMRIHLNTLELSIFIRGAGPRKTGECVQENICGEFIILWTSFDPKIYVATRKTGQRFEPQMPSTECCEYVIELKIIDVVLSEYLAYRIKLCKSPPACHRHKRDISDIFQTHNLIKLMRL